MGDLNDFIAKYKEIVSCEDPFSDLVASKWGWDTHDDIYVTSTSPETSSCSDKENSRPGPVFEME